MGGVNKVEVINSKGCSKLFVGFSSSVPSFRSFQSFEPMSPASTSLVSEPVRSTGPFSGLVICVTGLSKEARKQVMEATERLGGQYSTSLHPQCTHLVVQISFSHCYCFLYIG
ncbi:DNA topoisomerase 2-binding 1 [Gossypium australe]|uniref:DNA topoisomerase 2-binding 1 n=1 Tax=Gossypium australe TaxID=47621 RepID=A0A5B6XAP4_9ROSI|nr:DNA topoisomerase 2-binding 1 [Gossypium australe]